MKKYLSTLLALALCSTAAKAQVVLSIDFNDRSFDTPANLETNFNSFVIGSVGSAGAIQTNATTRNYGAIAVTLSGNGTNPGYDDRLRAVPSNSVAFTQERLLKDVAFSPDTTTNGGLNITVTGLISNGFYRITIWSFDNSSTGARVSDWFVNGLQLIDNYTFNGSNLPTNNSQYQFTMTAQASATGELLLQGRRDATTSSAGGVFLNALQLETTLPEPPVITGNPVSVDLYQGDNTSFIVKSGGTPPITYQWFHDQTNLVANATNATLFINDAQLPDAGLYHAVVANISGSATSAPATLIVRPITSPVSGLLAYWPLDTITDHTPDVSGNIYNLWATNMDAGNLTNGQVGNSLSFNGMDEFLTRTNAPGEALPAYAYPAYSLTLWVKGNFAGQNDRRVFSESSNTNNNPLVTIGTDSASNAPVVDILIRNNNNTSPVNHRKSSLAAFDGNWHHIAWVDNNGSAQLYVDGVQDTNSFNYTRGVLTPNIETLGAVYRTSAQAFFAGNIDDVAVWRRSLTSNEVQYVMANGASDPNLPAITVQPANQTVSCSGTAIFSVGASGAAPLSYQWHSVCGDISGATNATLVLTNVTLADAGNYFVTISNEFGVVTSDDARLAVNASLAPVLPRLHIAQGGANAEISWPAAASPFVLQEASNLNSPIAWTAANQVAVTNGTNLSVSVPFGAGNRFYRLISTNSISLCPPLPLSIVAMPVGRAVNIPATVDLSVTATGVGPLSYQWKLNGTTLPDKTNSSLSVSVMSLTNLGAYTVVMQDTLGTAYSSPAVIRLAGLQTVLADDFADRPLITNGFGSIHSTTFGATGETNEPVHAGIPGGKSVWLTWRAPATGIATFDTTGSGFDTLLAVYTGPDLSTLAPTASDDDSAGFLSSKVIFNAIADTDYHLAIDGWAGESGFFNLNWILQAAAETVPVITSHPQDALVASNQMAVFSVSNAPATNVTYQWKFEGTNLVGQTNSTLSRNGEFANIGNYAVVVSNGARSTVSRAASLQLATSPTDFHWVPKALVNFTCPSSSGNDFAPLGSKPKQPPGIVAGTVGTISAKIGSLSRSTMGICAKRTYEMYMTNLTVTGASGDRVITLMFKGDNSATTLEVYNSADLYGPAVACVVNTVSNGTSLSSLSFTAVSGGNYFVIVSATKTTTIVTVDYNVPL